MLAAFLDRPERPAEALGYHELQGFFFALACARDEVPVTKWLAVVFGGEEDLFETPEDVQAILTEIMTLYNDVVLSFASDEPQLPSDCEFREDALANLEPDAPVSQWSRGFTKGHGWLESTWETEMPADLAGDVGLSLLTITFFASERMARLQLEQMGEAHVDMAKAAAAFRQAFPDALVAYTHLAKIARISDEQRPAERGRSGDRIGRNDPCPCGSGRKYKKCCGQTH